MKKKSFKKVIKKTNKKKEDIPQNKNTAKLVLFVFGIGPILGILIFLAINGFFEVP